MSYHLTDGLHFERLDDPEGAVHIFRTDTEGHEFNIRVSDSEWASAVAAVSGRGEDGVTHQQALDFHNEGINAEPVEEQISTDIPEYEDGEQK